MSKLEKLNSMCEYISSLDCSDSDYVSHSKRQRLYEEILRDIMEPANIVNDNQNAVAKNELDLMDIKLPALLSDSFFRIKQSDTVCIQLTSTLNQQSKYARKRKFPFGYWNDKDRCRAEAAKYNTRSEFLRGSVSAYNSAYKHKWLDEICSHMISLIHPSGIYF